jgi:putative acetyltransferase
VSERFGEFVIRASENRDEADLIRIFGACYGEYEGCVLAVDEELPQLRRIADWAREQDGEMWTVERARDGRVVACGGYVRSAPDTLEIRHVYVLPEARRNGLAARLVEKVVDAARARGCTVVDLWSDTRFLDAHRLYERLGFARGPGTRELRDLSDTVEFYFRRTV